MVVKRIHLHSDLNDNLADMADDLYLKRRVLYMYHAGKAKVHK